MAKKLADLLFLGTILLVLTAGLISTLLFPDEINYNENRYANQMPAFTPESYLDGSFQQGVDDALGDQVNLASFYKRIYNYARTASLRLLFTPVAQANRDRYIHFQGMQLFGGDYLVYSPSVLAYMTDLLDARIANYNETFARLPDTEFYVYFVGTDGTVNFETGEKIPIYEYIRDRLELPEDRMSDFAIDGFETYAQLFYRTDHHWNHRGSYQGYLEVLDLLGVEDGPLVPLEEAALPGRFSGSKAAEAGAAGVWESVSVYRFDFPGMEVTINGRSAEDYGSQFRFLSGQGGDPSYSGIYGGDEGEVVLSGGKPGGGNLLVVGESYDNALLKLLACHFESLYSVDLRYYRAYMGADLQLSEYLREHDIHKVLLIGSTNYFFMDEFHLEG